ncbi:MAG: hypothetical protein Q7J73_01125, partial [Dehalococcoidales bacterium]|nr:hypothetical protein [Dehalococcoidales bacterium]
FERSLAVKSPLTLTDGGANSTITFGLSSDSLDFDEFVDSMTLDANLTVSSGSGPFSTTWHGDFFLKDNASVSGNFEVSGNASASQTYGSGLTTCTASNSKLTWDSSTGKFICATESEGLAGSIGIREGYSGVFTDRSSISFNGAHFTVNQNSLTEASISLDWGLGGPASLSQDEEITGNWVNTINPWADDEVANTLTLTNITGPTSLSGNFELQTGYASASQYFGATLADCDSNGSQLLWSNTGLFSCQTLNDDDIPDTITLTRYLDSDIPIVTIGNTASSAFERSLAVKSPLTLTDGGVNSTITFGLSSDSLDFDEFVDSMTLDANLTVASAGFNTTWNGNFYHMQGNVGIGTTGPGTPLHILKTAASGLTDMLRLETSSSPTNGGQSIQFNNLPAWSLARIGTRESAGYKGNIVFETNSGHNDTVTAEVMRIQYDGNVGIGTTGPGGLLEVDGNLTGSANSLFKVSSGSTAILDVLETGNVGIGTTSPTTKLDVIGNASVSQNFEVGTNLYRFTSTGASSSEPFEFTDYASASKYFGAAFGSTGDCNDSTEALGWDSGTGLFNCR